MMKRKNTSITLNEEQTTFLTHICSKISSHCHNGQVLELSESPAGVILVMNKDKNIADQIVQMLICEQGK